MPARTAHTDRAGPPWLSCWRRRGDGSLLELPEPEGYNEPMQGTTESKLSILSQHCREQIKPWFDQLKTQVLSSFYGMLLWGWLLELHFSLSLGFSVWWCSGISLFPHYNATHQESSKVHHYPEALPNPLSFGTWGCLCRQGLAESVLSSCNDRYHLYITRQKIVCMVSNAREIS